MRKNKKRNKFFSVNVNPKKCEKGSILFFPIGIFQQKMFSFVKNKIGCTLSDSLKKNQPGESQKVLSIRIWAQ